MKENVQTGDLTMRIVSRSIVLMTILLSLSGCWLAYTWEDYLPIASIALKESVSCYSATFNPKRAGKHVLALRIQRKYQSPVRIGLRLRGEIVLAYADGFTEKIPFEQDFCGDFTIPPTPYDLSLAHFNVKEHGRMGDCVVSVRVQVNGDIGALLRREPDWRIIARFDETE